MENCKGSAGLVEYLKMLSAENWTESKTCLVNEMKSVMKEQQFCAFFTYSGVNYALGKG